MSTTPGPASGLTLGPLHVPTPVVLAPMAGITNAAYRRLCAEQGAGLYVCEMITSRGLVEGDQRTRDMLVFDELETVRSVQLYGTDPVYVGKAAEILCAEYGVAHIDLNFGCPVPKVTRKGGGGGACGDGLRDGAATEDDSQGDHRGGGDEGERAGHEGRSRRPAGIGVPLVAMVCHSADP